MNAVMFVLFLLCTILSFGKLVMLITNLLTEYGHML